MFQRHNSTLLDLEAANYFELDPSQMNLLNVSNVSLQNNKSGCSCSGDGHMKSPFKVVNTKYRPLDTHKSQTTGSSSSNNNINSKTNNKMQSQKSSKQYPNYQPKERNITNIKTSRLADDRTGGTSKEASKKRQYLVDPPAESSSLSVALRGPRSPSTSTGSLPSITSSPSLSPSLVCPHLSLDDILSRHMDGTGNRSAHTIGLCEKCLVCPPPDIHSPLSPAFRPSVATSKRQMPPNVYHSDAAKDSSMGFGGNGMLRRGYSDQQIGVRGSRRGRGRGGLGLPAQDDSLDYYLTADELKRLQMSPSIRNSVEYIRKNTTESGRVVKIYKNGQPFDKPLRICILRGEFANLNHLLDHINSRQLIPSGARYLFHLDGQLVYSENELKHGSCYIVSGTRSFDFKVNNVLKERQSRELQMKPMSRQASNYTPTVHMLHQPNNREHRSQSQQLVRQRDPSISRDVAKIDRQPVRGISPSNGRAVAPTTSSILRRKSSIDKTTDSRKVDAINDAHYMPKMVKGGQVPTTIKVRPKSRQSQANTGLTAGRKPTKNEIHTSNIKSEMSNSNETLVSMKNLELQQPAGVVRAKSELSALPRNKRKKNVTFVDTGRGSSPAINIKPYEETRFTGNNSDLQKVADTTAVKELETNEIGIQVSDTPLEGFLIDLPIAIPINRKRESSEKSQVGINNNINSNNRNTTQRRNQKIAGTSKRKHAKVVTITERQLSFDEMGQLKDMDQGDHHNDSHKIQHVSITLATDDMNEEPISLEPESIEIVLPDRSDTINIGQEPSDNNETIKHPEQSGHPGQWQYPDDPQRPGTSASTPTERPVSQSEANEAVHARVTTPTPSLSTMGDNNSLTMSYDYSHHQRNDEASIAALIASLPDKQRIPVLGKLRQGLDPPQRNFKLIWVNGFIINDQYPENSIASASLAPADTSMGHRTDTKSPATGSLLTPTDNKRQLVSHFKPSDRFHNWVCHSRRHDELIYPAGSLVVLWCRLTNEQRYYFGHTSNISALTLASLDDDLVASAQIGDSNDRSINSTIHLWSLNSLETLRVIEDDHLKNKKIFSLKVRNTDLDGCEVSVGGREDKSIWFYVFFLKLDRSTKEEIDLKGGAETSTKSKQSSPKRIAQIVIKANKVLQVNQTPLLITRLSNVRGEQPKVGRKSSLTSSQADLFGNVMISFGRRHFQVWFIDRKRQSLVALQALSKSSYFVDLIVRASCSARMSPNEFLVGDSVGNLVLMTIKLHKSANDTAKGLAGSPNRTLFSNYKYSIESLPLIDANNLTNETRAPITCIARISGSLFVTADHTCAVKFWKILRSTSSKDTSDIQGQLVDATREDKASSGNDIRCHQLGCLRLPRDLGFICTIILTKYVRTKPTSVEFYAISTSNAILFGSVQLKTETESLIDALKDRAPVSCSLSVIYEGHESPAMSLVADSLPKRTIRERAIDENGTIKQSGDYFTCSLDCKICRWSDKNLVWKSMLPSACASLAVHPIGFVLAVGSADGTVYILDKVSGLLISYFPLTPVCINCLAYSRDGTLLAAGCANGSIFILPVYERGLKYKKVSILQSPHPVVSLQFSVDNKYILTSVTHGLYQELILWDMPNFRYMRNNVKLAADKIEWYDSICSGSEDVRAIWENANLEPMLNEAASGRSKLAARRLSVSTSESINTSTIINLSCHRLIRGKQQAKDQEFDGENFVIASDTRGYLRLFRYPCSDVQQGFYETRVGSSAMSCCRFLALKDSATIDDAMFVSSSLDGSICLWSLC